ncbi:hypothetical protein HTS61_25125 [Escherichia coli]|nr:hypothetical protein [Escherichia coli]
MNEPGNGAFVSPDVRIGGPLLVVRDIRSGRSQITPGGNRGADVSSPGQNAF